jgi:uncharacterized membrane protein
MRPSDLLVLILAIISILFQTPGGHWGLTYGGIAVFCLILSIVSTLNWQTFPAYLVLFVRLILVDYFQVSTY